MHSGEWASNLYWNLAKGKRFDPARLEDFRRTINEKEG